MSHRNVAPQCRTAMSHRNVAPQCRTAMSNLFTVNNIRKYLTKAATEIRVPTLIVSHLD